MMEMEQEVVYGTHEDSHVVMSEKVQNLAGSIYQEFEKMILKYDDEEVVKDLMPLVVNVLESLDLSYTENQEHEVELELLREDNEQLVTQYEREKQLRKTSEQKLLEVEDSCEDERKDLGSKIESLESIVRMLELKSKNASDHVYRLEEKETEHNKEFSKLHDRYTELFKTHMDYMERAKMLMGSNDRIEANTRPRGLGLPSLGGMNQLNRSSGPMSLGFASLEAVMRSREVSEYSGPVSPPDSNHSNTSLRNEMQEFDSPSEPLTSEKSQLTDPITTEHRGTLTRDHQSPDSEELVTPVAELPSPIGRSKTKRESRSGNTLYQELSFQDADALGEMDEGADITGSWVHPGDYASSVNDNFFGMGKEVENLIMENNELLATKNALNIVKDDLIIKVDELTSEHEILREQLKAVIGAKTRLATRVSDLEDDLKRAKEEVEKANRNARSDDDEDVPMAQRKRFTRVEMARVLMERNQYKERFMELQEAVRWTEMIRASRHEPGLDKKGKQSVWKFFSNLFGPAERVPRPNVAVQYLAPTRPALDAMRKRTLGARRTNDVAEEKMAQRRANERREQLRQVRAHVRKDDGRLQAYGWSLPARAPATKSSSAGNQVPVPVPVYCRPLAEKEPGTKIWCAAGVSLGGGKTRDGGNAIGASVFYSDARPKATDQQLTSLVWICTSAHAAGRVTVIDANNPADILDAFDICSSHLLCIASVPGACESDYSTEEEAVDATPLPATIEEVIEEGSEADGGGDEGYEAGHVRTACSSPVSEDPPRVGGDAPPLRLERDVSPVVKDGREDVEEAEVMSTVLGTMWLGAQDGSIYIHSAVAQWSRRLNACKLRDAVLGIVHVSGRTVVALADGTVASFSRGPDGQWDLTNYLLVDLGRPHHSIRCLAAVHGRVWCGYRNQLHVVHPRTLAIERKVDAHPRKESQVRQLAPLGDGVWVSIRLDSTLRLFHAKTLEHLQDVDIEPYVSKMLGTGKLGFSFVRITALLISSSRLWIGTGNGVVISVPLSPGESRAMTGGGSAPGGVVRLADGLMPYCSMAQAQLSFHGHRDAVKFFVAVPGSGVLQPADEEEGKEVSGELSMLVMSGGEGYIDFRIVDDAETETVDGGSHLVVWRIIAPDSVVSR